MFSFSFFLAEEHESEDETSQISSYSKRIMPGLSVVHHHYNPVFFSMEGDAFECYPTVVRLKHGPVSV